MSEAPRKKRFQVHLSTAVVLMIAAGVILWANTTVNELSWKDKIVEDGIGSRVSRYAKSYGWPDEVWTSQIQVRDNGSTEYVKVLNSTVIYVPVDSFSGLGEWRLRGIIVNTILGAAILCAVWFVCEWWIRRQKIRVFSSHGLK